jgi:hypothetical protein
MDAKGKSGGERSRKTGALASFHVFSTPYVENEGMGETGIFLLGAGALLLTLWARD